MTDEQVRIIAENIVNKASETDDFDAKIMDWYGSDALYITLKPINEDETPYFKILPFGWIKNNWG